MKSKALPVFQVDAFTDRPFGGNPAGVCILAKPLADALLQNIAREMNLSETAFLLKEKDGFRLRWFTPLVEVELCGHATLASSFVLWNEGYLEEKQAAKFFTRSGILLASRQGDWIELDFPQRPVTPVEAPAEILQALKVKSLFCAKSKLDYLLEVKNEKTVRELQPDFNLLLRANARGVIVTSVSASAEYDFVSRFFAPAVGINEDPVTGSAHCSLGPYWGGKLHKSSMKAYQASERGGQLKVRLSADRVFLSGQAVMVMVGELRF